MPFKSQAQRGFMFANHPKIAEEFQAATPKNAKLPEHVMPHMANGGLVPSGDWQAIKNWVVAHAPTDDKEQKHEPMPKAPGFSNGGIIDKSAGGMYADGGMVNQQPQPMDEKTQAMLQAGQMTPQMLAVLARLQAQATEPVNQQPIPPSTSDLAALQAKGLGYSDGGQVPMDPGIPGLPGVPELPGVPRRHNQAPPQAPKGYADGGDVSGPDFLQGLTNGSIPVRSEAPEAAPMPAVNPATQPQMPLPGPNAVPVTPQPSAQDQASQILGGGAPARAALAQKLAAPSIGGSLALLGGGIGDAITRASGKGDSGFAKQILEQQNRRENLGLENFDKSAGLGKDQYALQQQVEAKDPNSKLSKQAQDTYGALLSKSGFKAADIAKMPASLIADLTGKNVEQIKAESEAKMAAASLGLKEVTEQANIAHQKAEEANQNTQRTQEAAKTLAGRGLITRLTDAIAGNPGVDTLESQLSKGQTPTAPTIAAPTAPQTVPHPQDQAAIQWAQSHQGDPRAAKILKLHGI